ncbi:MAG: phosphoribosylformylglycinamidine cyclo-ligase, partial [Aminivibrio sp.]|nr:phosphoribosylformylglycinamidine cyclo-ligase [Aminivibrio sp.]
MNLNYRDAGVDIPLADQWVGTIRNIVRSMPPDPNVLGGIGGFSGLYRLPGGLVLAGCCDGVGTKIEVAKAAENFDGIGQDLVAMNVNDLVTCGARPLFFLDYIACGRLKPEILGPIVESAARACRESG